MTRRQLPQQSVNTLIHHAWLVFLALLLLFVSYSPTHAQRDGFEPITQNGVNLGSAWSIDSRRFVFGEGTNQAGVRVTDESWYEYEIETGILKRGNVWPLQPTLTGSERRLFDPAITPDGRASFMYPSPNGRYVAYAHFGTDIINVDVADRHLHRDIHTPAYVFDPFFSPYGFRVLWSEDSTTFVTLTQQPLGSDPLTPQYVSDFNTGYANLTFIDLGYLNVDGRKYGSYNAYDISKNGRFVLLRVDEYTAGGYSPLHLMVWDAENPDASHVVDDFSEVVEAAFAPGDESKLLILTELGLVLYDITSDGFTVLTEEINSTWVSLSFISPDGQQLAVTDHGGWLYVVDIVDFVLRP